VPVDDLGEYDAQPVDGNPFGAMAASPNDYDVSPVDHDPFASAPPTISGHVAASPDPNQPMTAKYIAARSQESANPYTPPLYERAGNYVSNTAQSYGVPTQGAERLGSATSTGLEAASYAPIVGAPLTAAEGVDAYSRGDVGGAVASGLGTLASFFGPWAKTADLGAMKMAQKMARKGAPAEDIIGKTGWFQGPEGMWRFERPDEGATFTGQGNFSRNLKLGDVYQNPEQYAAYPNLRLSDVEMLDPEYADQMGMLGGFNPSRNPRAAPPGTFLFRHDMPQGSTIPIHETTHAIQDIEGFAPGGSNLNPMQVLSTKSAQPFFQKQLDRAIAPRSYNEALRAGEPISRGVHGEIEQLKGLVRAGHEDMPGGIAENAAWGAGSDWYLHQAGEAEARNAAFRAGNPLIAKAFHPWETSDIPWDELMLPPYRGSGGRVGPSGGPVQLNADLRRRLALLTRSRRADGGGLDDDADRAINTAQESANDPGAEGVPAVAPSGSAGEGDWNAQGSGGRGGPGYPASPSERYAGAYSGALGGSGLRRVGLAPAAPPGGDVGQAGLAPADPDAFHQAISAAKAAHPDGAQVALHSPEEYAQMRPFLSPDGKEGFALNDDDIVSVFRHPAGQSGAAARSLEMATNLGGRRLDAFDTYLPSIYSRSGFKPVARLPFDDQYAPEGWDYEHNQGFNGGRPDVVFMVHDPENASHVGGKPVATYDEGVAAQHEALKEIAGRPLMAPQLVGRPATSLVGEEERLMRQREGLEPPGGRTTEWAGGRVGYAGGGPVQLNTALRRRLGLITRPRFADGGAPDPTDPNNAAFA
jgi:hypothetical protein